MHIQFNVTWFEIKFEYNTAVWLVYIEALLVFPVMNTINWRTLVI